jgi:hypothetical protein
MRRLVMYTSKNDNQSVTNVLYFNGLGHGKMRKRERLAIRYLNKRGIKVTHARVDWYAGESFTDLFDRMVALTKQQLKVHVALTLVGSSAGGSLVVNILGKLHGSNLTGITLCSRLHEAPLKWWDKRNLTRMAHIGGEHPSQAFFDSVTYCGSVTIPKLTDKDKQNLILVQQWADFVVPRPTMSINDVRIYKVSALGHGWGIAMGVGRLPEVVRLLDKYKH